jgi:alcohol dehydrogenase (NADP+)
MMEASDLRMTRMPLNNGAGDMPALGFGTLIPDPALTRKLQPETHWNTCEAQ